jgi:hypothetical protein
MNEISPRDELLELVADLIGTLEWESQRGAIVVPSETVHPAPVDVAPVATAPGETRHAPPARPTATPSPRAPTPSTRAPLPAQWAQWTAKRGQALDELQVAIRACRACARCEARKQVVVGEGQGTSGLMILATEPGDRGAHQRAAEGCAGRDARRMLARARAQAPPRAVLTTVLTAGRRSESPSSGRNPCARAWRRPRTRDRRRAPARDHGAGRARASSWAAWHSKQRWASGLGFGAALPTFSRAPRRTPGRQAARDGAPRRLGAPLSELSDPDGRSFGFDSGPQV